MVYYNKDLFEKHKVEVPTTFEEFTAALDTFVKAGVTPIGTAGAEYPAQQIFYQLALSKADRAWVDAFQAYQGKVDFHGPPSSPTARRRSPTGSARATSTRSPPVSRPRTWACRS
ncbi:extracellular solute-binding protein [Nonomuraea ferruginea]